MRLRFFITVNDGLMMNYYDIKIKRKLDLIMSIIFLLVFLPLFIIIPICIKFSDGGKVLFTQRRMGKNKKIFLLYKFRTMTDKEHNNKEEIFDDNPDITKIGKFLRKYKLDEIPQFYNIMRGDMSFVGPRPRLPVSVGQVCGVFQERFKVSPGLTGLAQVNGNIYLSWPARYEMDRKYVSELGLLLDLKILWKTLIVVILGEKYFYNDN